jgi:hypothetical protein
MRHALLAGLVILGLAACGGSGPPPAAPAPGSSSPAASPPTQPANGAAASPATVAGAGSTDSPDRKGELLNPDNNTMVFLYHDLAGLAPPIDSWVEKDNRVTFAQPIDKAAARKTVRAEIEAGLAAVRDAGRIRLTLANANLSDYDPTYGEFTIRALAPSSEVSFAAFGEDVKLRFANSRAVQTWKVPADEAQAIRDKVGLGGGGFGNVELDLLLQVKSVQPGSAGGTLLTDVLEYELRDSRSGATLHRVPAGP